MELFEDRVEAVYGLVSEMYTCRQIQTCDVTKCSLCLLEHTAMSQEMEEYICELVNAGQVHRRCATELRLFTLKLYKKNSIS